MTASIKSCPGCNKSCLTTDVFCPQCGYRFPSQSQGAQGGSLVCSVCGYRRSSFDTSCPQCAKQQSIGALQPNKVYPSPAPVMPPQPPAPVTGYNPYPAPTMPLQPGQILGQVPHIQCPSCHNWVPQGTQLCPYCTAVVSLQQPGHISNPQAPVQQVIIQQVAPYGAMVPYRPRKEKATAGILAILLGGFGAQRFYLGQTGLGILSILFCWTYIPSLIGIIEGIILLCMDEQEFHRRHG